ncbi:hypothetical protein [Mesohalobacter halotolerans]|uniref:Uncharacterized protein n=1 Tax=Mesohalobacter halotolerans TaxID=1883405 RepID=A0A4U5TQV8_9FLAO|nr:hypothetical protein [Mesohalobacter halotolerans]MBS3739643.1 hypothetical protein [Psychroflexus sp.]TKS56609.1 hypothetical protein FCN74_06135 [Mesohalobacter halotolerans]
MKYPRFLLADNAENDIFYVIHTDFPRFILNINTDELEFWENFDEEEAKGEYDTLVKEAFDFYDSEIEQYDS